MDTLRDQCVAYVLPLCSWTVYHCSTPRCQDRADEEGTLIGTTTTTSLHTTILYNSNMEKRCLAQRSCHITQSHERLISRHRIAFTSTLLTGHNTKATEGGLDDSSQRRRVLIPRHFGTFRNKLVIPWWPFKWRGVSSHYCWRRGTEAVLCLLRGRRVNVRREAALLDVVSQEGDNGFEVASCAV
jgi:hypothetical protein